jgi:hypothetical protein
MPEYEIPNPQVRAHAEQIADTAIFLYGHILEINCVPSVLLEGTLAIELYLKSLSSRTIAHPLDGIAGYQLTATPMCRTHLLDDLFDAIDEPIRNELQVAYAAAPAIPRVTSLRDALNRYRSLFVGIRYVFEARDGGGNDITGLIDLVKLFRRVVSGMPQPCRFG